MQKKHTLTKREKEVLEKVCGGLNSREIASELNISIYTVHNHRKNILQKTDAKNLAEVVAIVSGRMRKILT